MLSDLRHKEDKVDTGKEWKRTYADSSDTGPATASPPSSKYLKHPSLRIAKSAVSSAGIPQAQDI